jgi:hypothetical protein
MLQPALTHYVSFIHTVFLSGLKTDVVYFLSLLDRYLSFLFGIRFLFTLCMSMSFLEYDQLILFEFHAFRSFDVNIRIQIPFV